MNPLYFFVFLSELGSVRSGHAAAAACPAVIVSSILLAFFGEALFFLSWAVPYHLPHRIACLADVTTFLLQFSSFFPWLVRQIFVCLSIAQHSPRPLVKSGSWKMNNIRWRKIERFLSQLFPTRVPSSPDHTAIAIFAFVLRSDEKCSIYWNCPLLSGMGPLDSGRCKRIRAWRRNPECLWVSFFFLVACTLIGARFRKLHFGPSPHFCTVYLMWTGRANLQRNRANYGHLGW